MPIASNIALQARELTKVYRKASQEETRKFYTAQPTLPEKIRHQLQHYFGAAPKESVHVLNNLSFKIHKGESVALLGCNGAGKSTLLKIISKITPPSSGTLFIRGRVGSLLEVGTGFHPELTGRDNVYLNGAILGMKQQDIRRRFDEIVSFAQVEEWIDTPIKHFSSGMSMRLAFAVAAHLDAEILMIDEVLGVGDAQFQERCFDKLKSLQQEGRTLLYVSHNMESVKKLCQRSIVLEKGTIIHDGEIL